MRRRDFHVSWFDSRHKQILSMFAGLRLRREFRTRLAYIDGAIEIDNSHGPNDDLSIYEFSSSYSNPIGIGQVALVAFPPKLWLE